MVSPMNPTVRLYIVLGVVEIIFHIPTIASVIRFVSVLVVGESPSLSSEEPASLLKSPTVSLIASEYSLTFGSLPMLLEGLLYSAIKIEVLRRDIENKVTIAKAIMKGKNLTIIYSPFCLFYIL